MVLGKIRNHRGAGSIGCLFVAALTGAALYAGFQFGMPRLRHSSFEERVTETFAGNPRHLSATEAQKSIIEIAKEFDIALTPAQVKVEDAGGGRLRIDVTYEKVIDLKVWQTTVPFRLHRSQSS